MHGVRHLIGIASLLVLTGTAAAEPPRNAMQADLGLTVIGFGYERVVAPQLALGAMVTTMGTWFGPTYDQPWMGGHGVGVRATWFPRATASRGLYVAPYVRAIAASVKQDTDGNDVDGGTTRLGVTGGVFVGYAWLLAGHWQVRAGVGVQYIDLAAADADGNPIAFRSAWPAIDAVVGYAF